MMTKGTLVKIKGFVVNLSHKRLFRKVSITTLISVCIAYLAVWIVFLVPHMMVAAQAWQYIMVDYVKINEVNPNELFSKALGGLQSSIVNRDVSVSEGIIESMLELIDDPYTKYLTPDEYAGAMHHLSGSYVGIGIVMTVNEDGQLEVLSVMPGFPADEAGMKAGDIILTIDGQPADNQTTGWAADLLRGEADTDVVLSILHDGETESVPITVTRREIDLPNVAAEEIEDNIVYIKLNSFSEDSGEDFKEELGKYLDDDTIGVIVDVRDNPGGIVDDAITIISQFVEGDTIVAKQVDGDFEVKLSYSSKDDGLATNPDLRVAVLQNNDSASASEIFAGALQDVRSDTTTAIIGTSSYGKGSINHIIQLVDGSAMIITSSFWTTPDDRYIGTTGIEPDIVVEDEEAQLDKAIDYVKNTL
jgi:carboxyl-terminal processing protease